MIGGELAFVADNDPGAAATLAYHYPSVKNLGDITGVDWGSVEPVEVLAGGFPCTDVSCAGARAGLKHGNRSGLWHEFVKAIAAHRPRLVVIENVLGLLTARGDEPTAEHLAAEAHRDTLTRLSWWPENELDLAVSRGDKRRARVCRARIARLRKLRKRADKRCEWHERRLIRAIGTVLASLESLEYDAEWVVVTASAAGACHRRARLFILAFPAETRTVPVPGDPVAVITDGAWLEPLENLFGSAPYTGRVPASGRMAGGRIYAAEPGPMTMAAGLLPTPTAMDARVGDMNISPEAVELQLRRNDPDGSRRNTTGSLTKDLLLLKTPTAQLAVNGGSQHPDKRRAGGHGPTLADQVEHELLPTPTARLGDDTSRGADAARFKGPQSLNGRRSNLDDCIAAVSERSPWLFPPEHEAADADLTEAVTLLPTPAAGNFNDGEDLASREARRQRNLAKCVNGNGQGTPLPIAVQQLAAGVDWGPYEAAIRRWETVTSRLAPRPTVPGRTGERLNPALPEWMQGLPAGWITAVPGLSRNAMLELAGNGVVPQQGALALRILLGRAGIDWAWERAA